ncbi:ergosteryl-beta-glucosidase [Diutina catenulata]
MSRARKAISDRMSIYGFGAEATPMRPLNKQIPKNTPFDPVVNDSNSIVEISPLAVKDGELVNAHGNYVSLKGINLDAAMKLPVSPVSASYQGDSSDPDNVFFEGDTVSFVGRPFPLEDAHEHFMRIKGWGYNTIRYLLTWEAVEHEGPGKHDKEFIDYTVKMLRIIDEVGGLYVILEMHQDVWSRFTGGSGAPMWTLYAAGLDPTKFHATEAALLHNDPKFHRKESPEKYAKMIWTTNYKRLACFTMFTLFFSGRTYFPTLELNGENIQDYLQRHFFGSIRAVWQAIHDQAPELVTKGMILGIESMNEPNPGLMGHCDLDELPLEQQLRVGTTPTVFQALKTGMGFAADIDYYKITIAGPQKKGSVVIDPQGVRAWLLPERAATIDAHYGWRRSADWTMGECIFHQNKVWRWHPELDLGALESMGPQERLAVSNEKTILLKPNYFCKVYPGHVFPEGAPTDIDFEYFLTHNFTEFFLRHKQTTREVSPNAFVLMQNPVLEQPPLLKGDPRNVVDDKFIWTPHYYDGLSLMFKTWNSKYNVDTLGIMRGKYANPVLGIVFGERAIRNCIRKQFSEIKAEAHARLGKVPVLMSETGMPFDMDSKRAYVTHRYHAQTAALDAISYALEGCQMHHTYWTYCCLNNHRWGDNWNNEDFSFWSPEDKDLAIHHPTSSQSPSTQTSRRTSRQNSLSLFKSSFKNRRDSVASKLLERTSSSATRRPSASGELTPKTPPSPLLKSAVANGVASPLKNYQFNQEPLCFRREEDEHGPKEGRARSGSPAVGPSDGREGSPGVAPTTTLDDAGMDSLTLNTESVDSERRDSTASEDPQLIPTTSDRLNKHQLSRDYPSVDGVRAVSAVVRPFVVSSPGLPVTTEFDLPGCKYLLTVQVDFEDEKLKTTPTIIFLPRWHFPFVNSGDIYISGGHVKYHQRLEYLEWYHEREEGEGDAKTTTEASIMIRNYSGPITEAAPDGKNYCPIA